jgi:hypothetical protein
MWRELTREARWFASSRTSLTLIITAFGLAIWGAVSGAVSSLAAIASFQATLDRYKENGEDIAGALDSPATVDGDAAQQLISNPLRYDLDQAALALTQLEPTGAISSTLSLCALVVFPILGFVLGVFVSTHDIKSGSLAFRWPNSGIVSFVGSKPLSLLLGMGALTLLTALLSVPFSWAARHFVADAALEIAAFGADVPSLAQTAAIGALSILYGSVAAALGLLTGAVTRNRTFTVAIFSVAYLLVPMLGSADLRNIITLAGRDVLNLVGQIRPHPIGDTAPSVAVWTLVAIAIGFVLLSTGPWLLRCRTEHRSLGDVTRVVPWRARDQSREDPRG